MKTVFQTFDGHKLTDEMLEEAAKLFSGNYGIWGDGPANPKPTTKAGKSD